MKKTIVVLMIFLLVVGCSQSTKGEKLALDDPLVTELYGYVEMTSPSGNNYYFYTEPEITVSTFKDVNKHHFAFRLLDKSDFTIKKSSSCGTYTLKPETFRKAIEKYFGPEVEYEVDEWLFFVYARADLMPKCSLVAGYYNPDKNIYHGVFNYDRDVPEVLPIYTKLISAIKLDDTIVLTQKYIFTTTEYGEKTTYKVFADIHAEIIFDTFDDGTVPQISIEDYLDKAGTIEFTFKLGPDNEYHFYSSAVK
jgi:hypothetical protein